MNPDCEHSLKKDTPILYGSWVRFDKKISDSRVLEEKWWPIDTHTHARTQARTHAHTHANLATVWCFFCYCFFFNLRLMSGFKY